MKLITNFTRVITLLFSRYIQTTLLIIGLLLINLGVLTMIGIGAFLVCSGLSMVVIALLINYERRI
ncbi:hypothetical protein IMAU10239_02877 [Lactiplantibacillus plantarum]|nr:hypothetical protein [Lactiplantibacillus plantarum]MCG0915487.1 hypothetical protein [Lactiplantibacillus plantarum]